MFDILLTASTQVADPRLVWTAVYAAAISTLVLLWNIYVYFRDKGSIKVNCSIAKNRREKKTGLKIEIVNKGRRDISITKISFGSRFYPFVGIEKTVYEFDPIKKLSHSDKEEIEIFDVSLFINYKWSYVLVSDSFGKAKKVKATKLFNTIKEELINVAINEKFKEN
jgi:hypothetical protein